MTRLFIDFNSISQFEYINSSAEDILGLLSGDGMEAELPLPFLETLSIHYFRSVAFGSGTTPGLQPHIALSHLVTSRSLKANCPLTCLRVHTCVPLSSGTKTWSVELIRWSELDPWPRERVYPDLHDPFMVLSQPPLPVEIPEVAPAPTKEKKGWKFRKLYNW
ncbi:hypothetical protein AAF712_000559 [Marasmius tenuissimus]|uniref:Uncharacterized protein n=1 Tax=Marasmius tenuissimus TaxID=585030 RepID=A0ABR3AHD6_9AGAR|nr:hypothetical protein PM082_001430 [Marasmius tenuissimus]